MPPVSSPVPPPVPLPLSRARPRLSAAVAACALAACTSVGQRAGLAQQDDFGSTSTHSRSFPRSPAQTCEAARRALLSQGYVINAATADLVNGRKHFQPENEVHVEVEFRVVCATDVGPGGSTIAFVSALQDRYALKKVNNSASVGVGVLGSVSLPFSSSDDALVKVSSETLDGGPFYDRFFRLLERYLPPVEQPPPQAVATTSPVASASVASAPLPEPAASAPDRAASAAADRAASAPAGAASAPAGAASGL